MAERPLYTLYKNLKAQNFDVPDDYDKFESALTRNGKGGADNRHAIYENLKAQNFDVPDTYERFYSALFHPVSKDSSRANGGSVPMSAADKARFSAGASNIAASARQTVNNAGRYNKLKQRKQKQQKDFGRVNIGSHQTPYGGDANNVVKDDFAYNPETGKAGAYVTSDSDNATNLAEAQQKQAVLDEQNNAYQEAVNAGDIPSVFDVRDKNGNYDLQENIGKDGTYLTEEGVQNQLDKKLADAYARKKEIEDSIAEDNQKNGNPLLSYSASLGGGNGRDAASSDYRNKLATSLALVTQQIGALEAVKQYPTSSWGEDAWKALDNTAFTAKTWDFGLTDFATMGQMERIKTKMDNGIPLSGSDKMLLKSKVGADAAAALEDEKMGNIYRWTKIAGQSLPFMADFFLTGGYGGITKGLSRGALKIAAKRGMGKVSAAILKNTGIVMGDVIGSYAMAGTEQAMKTGADIMQRHMGNLYLDENGNYAFGTFDENGNLLHEGGETIGKALYKGLTSAMVENYTEKLFGHNYGIKKGALNFMEKHGMNRAADFFKNIGQSGWYTGSKKWMEKFGINGFAEEVMEEEIGIPLHALLDGEGKVSDLLDPKQQLDIIGGMAISVGSMYAMGIGTKPIKGAYNRAQYYRFKHKVDLADSDAQQLLGDNWEQWKEQMDNATNDKMGGVLYNILQQRDNMSKEQINAAILYGVNLMKMRGYNLTKTAEMNAREITNEPTTPEEEKEQQIDNAYSEGHEAEAEETHEIQIDQADKQRSLAALLGISEQQLSAMSNEELDALTGQNDNLDRAIYEYQLSNAKYQGVMDNAQDQVDLAAQRAASMTDMITDQTRGTVRNATIKGTQGANDYGVYIINGNLATHDDGAINISGSDQMIIYYDPTTGKVEHADASRFAALGDENPAEDVKAQAIDDAKEKAIKEISGIIDGRVDVGSQFIVTGSDGAQHTYEILADYGDGTAAISIDGNVVENPYSIEDLQNLKDLEDQKRLEAAKAAREQLEAERGEKKAEQQKQEEEKQEQQNQVIADLIDDNGNVVLADVVGNEDLDSFIVGEYNNKKTGVKKYKVVTLNADGTVSKPRLVDASKVSIIGKMSADEYKQTLNVPDSSAVEDKSGENETVPADVAGEEVAPSSETTEEVAPANETTENDNEESATESPAMTLEDGTIVPMLEDGNPDFSQLTAEQTAELYDEQFGEDADGVIGGWVNDAKKALDKANNMSIKGKNFVEQKASKEAKEKAIADAQAAYDSAVAIRDAYNERQLAKEENTHEGRRNLIEKARRKFNRLKGAVKDDAEVTLQLYQDTVGSVLHRLYDGTGIDVTDDVPLTAEEYVASSITPYSLNYEGNENSKGVKQETGLSREDFAKTRLLAKDGKGTTIDKMVDKLWNDRPSNLDSLDTQDIRAALLDLIMSGKTATDFKTYVQDMRINEAEKILEEQKRAEDNAKFAEEQKNADENEKVNESDAEDNVAESESYEESLKKALEKVAPFAKALKQAVESGDKKAIEKAQQELTDAMVSNNLGLGYLYSQLAQYGLTKRKDDSYKLSRVIMKSLKDAIQTVENSLDSAIQNAGLDGVHIDFNEAGDGWIYADKGSEWYNRLEALDNNYRWLSQDNITIDNVSKIANIIKSQIEEGERYNADIEAETAPAEDKQFPSKLREGKQEGTTEIPEDATDEKPLGEQKAADEVPFSAKDNGKQETTEERAANVEKNKVEGTDVVDAIIGKKTRKALDRIAKMMGAKIQYQYTDKLGNGWYNADTNTIYLTLDSSITEGVQFIFGHEMTHEIKTKNAEAFEELAKLVKGSITDFDKAVDDMRKRYSKAGLSGYDRAYYEEEVIADGIGYMMRDLNYAHTLAMKMSHPLLAKIHEIINRIRMAFHGTEYTETAKNIMRSIEQAYVKTANREAENTAIQEGEEGQRLSLRTKEAPKKTQKVFKLMRLNPAEEGKLFPLFIGNGEAVELGKWYDADSPKLQDLKNLSSKDYVATRSVTKGGKKVKENYNYGVYIVNNETGEAMSLADFKEKYSKEFAKMGNNPNVAALNWATDNGYRWIRIEEKNQGQSRYGGEKRSYYNYGINGTGAVSTFAMRPGWHAGSLPTMRQIGKGKGKNLRDDNFVWVEGEIPADIDYNEEAQKNADKDIPDHIPTDGYYLKATNGNKEASQADKVGWYVAGAFKANRIMSDKETRDIIDQWNNEHPDEKVEYDWKRESGKDFNAETMSLEDTPKFSIRVYHGSGADFSEFDFDHMGEGEGSQVFGWGGYVTSSKSIGTDYATRIDNDPSRRYYSIQHSNGTRFMKKYPTLESFLQGDKQIGSNSRFTEQEKTEYYYEMKRLAEPYHNLYEVNIPDDNGSNYLDWDKKPSDEVATKIFEGLYGLDAKTIDDMAAKDMVFKNLLYDSLKYPDKNTMIPLLVKTNSLTRGTVYDNGNVEDDIRFVYNRLARWMGSPKAASKFLSSIGFTGIKYAAGRNFGGAEEGDTNYVIFKPEDMKIAEHTKFSIRTYHGSQASFDHFDHSFMGSGEGAQAYGWGTYVSEVEGIAKAYAKQNARKHNDEYDEAVRAYNSAKKNYEFVRDSYEIQVERLKELEKSTPKDIEDSNRELEEAVKAGDTSKVEQIKADIDWFKETLKDARENVKFYEEVSLPNSKESFETAKKEMEELKPVRNLYTVGIPDDTGDNYLDWDEPMTEKQVEMWKNAANSLAPKDDDGTWKERVDYFVRRYGYKFRGEKAYKTLTSERSPKEVSLALKDAGFDGVKVIAQRNTGGNKEGKMNYVIFDENDAKITSHTKFSLRMPKPLLTVDGKPAVVKEDDGSVELNYATWQKEKEQVRDALTIDAGLDEDETDAILANADTIAEGMKDLMKKYPRFRDFQYLEAGNRDIIRDNGDYLSWDYSFNCIKKDAMNAVMDKLVSMGKSGHLGVTQVEAIKRILQKHKFLTPCVMCYVEGKRKVLKQSKMDEQKWNAVREAAGLDDKLMGEPTELTKEQEKVLTELSNGEGLERVKGYTSEKKEDGITADTVKKISSLMLKSDILRGNMNYEWMMSPSAFTKMYDKFGNTKLMDYLTVGQYRGKQLLEAVPFSINGIPRDIYLKMYSQVELKERGGLRQFSYEDARAMMFFDYYTQFLLMQGARAPEHLYTKRPFMPEMFGKTGAMINQSLIVDVWKGDEWHKNALGLNDSEYDQWLRDNAGFIPRGALSKDNADYEEGSTELVPAWSVESFPLDEAMKNVHNKDFKGNVGNTVVAPSHRFIQWALDNPDIHMILAYHATGGSPIMKSLSGYSLATAMDKGYHTLGKDGKAIKDLEVKEIGLEISGGALQWNRLLRRNGYDAKKAAQVYLDYCKENGLTPMFNYEGVVDHPNYYKMLTDFRVYDEDGKSIRQKAVKAVLPENWKEILNKYLEQEQTSSNKVSGITLDADVMKEIEAATKFGSIEADERNGVVSLLQKIYGKNNVEVLSQKDFDNSLDSDTEEGRAQMIRDNGGMVYGYAKGEKIVLNEYVFNANTPLHEHTHIYMKVLATFNPKLYERGMELWKDTPQWNEAKADIEQLGEEPTDERVFSECMAQFTGSENEKIIAEVTGVTDKNWMRKAVEWLKEMWEGVKSAFKRWTKNDLDALTAEQFAHMPLRSFYDETERKEYVKMVKDLEKAGGFDNGVRYSLKSMEEKPEGWKQANKKAIHIAETIERDPKFSLKKLDGTLINAGTYFSGGGLVEEGLKGIIDPVVAVEYDEKISGVYRNNFGQHIVTADVRDVDPKELVKSIDGEVEFFHASPVCKNFSQAKMNHEEVELDKETAQSTADFINQVKPKVVTIENVKGYRDSEAMKTITDALDKNGYKWDADVYNAADYGGYTNRERLIVRAVREGELPEKPKKMARKKGWYEAVEDIMPTLTEKKNGVAPWMDVRLKADGIDWRNIDKPLYVMGSAYANGKIPHAFGDELLPTLRTKSGDVIVMPDGKVYRASGRVLARVSGVSDDYKMPYSEALSHTIIGNGIPTQLTEHVIAPLLQVTLKPTSPEEGGNTKFSLKQQKEKIVEDAKKNGNYMLAPNGKKTRLDAEQWVNVRTNNFKKWFGDWEIDPENASKVVDENGEPMVVYHGRSTDFNTFEKKEGVRFVMGLEDKVKAEGFFFSPDKGLAEEFAGNAARHRGGKANVVPCFLNIRKPLDLVSEGYDNRYEDVTGWSWVVGMDSQDNLWEIMDEEGMADKMKAKGYDGAIFVEEVDDNYEPTKISYCALDANQIKSADNNNGEYSSDNNDIRFSLRVDQYQHDLAQWKKNNGLSKDAERPAIPVREPNENAADFMNRVKEYRRQMALWKTAPQYEQHLLSDDTAQGQFNLELQRSTVLARIALQDSMLAIRKAQEAIMKEVGVDRLNIAEDAYTAENRSHGKGKNEFEEYNDEYLQPLRRAYNQMMKNLGKSYDNVKVYMIAKHGLERNAHIAFKYALENDYEDAAQRTAAYKAYKSDMNRLTNDADFESGKINFNTWRIQDNGIRSKYAPSYLDYRYDKLGITQDYSGLSALFDGSDFEEAAADLVKDVEDKYGKDAQALWDATNAATKKILRDSHKAGMMSDEVYDFVRGMYRYYIPLRGWGDTNADQVWNYMGGGKGAFNQTLKEAKGRGSLADDPIAYIENMAESGILINNKNWVKQHLLLLAQNHPTSLLNVSKAWYVKTVDANGNEEWIPASPNITANMTSRQVEAELEAFQKKMEALEQNGDATQKREHLEITYPQTNSEEREHEVRVMKGGEEYVIYVNGDPQLAQAMNNTRAQRVRQGLENSISQRALAWLGRKMAAAYTSLSPLFIPSNFFRDTTMTLASTAIREDARYNYLLRKNMLTHWNTLPLVVSYQDGTLREKVRTGKASKTEQMFYDFMMNGGETGFVSSLDVEDLKKKFKNDLKDMNRMAVNPKKVGHIIMDSIETLNRAIEDSNRFMVYMTSVQYGRSIDEAVNDAKDVTLNFNRKGTGEHGWQTIRNLYLFINPAIQSLQTLGALAKHHPFKFTAVTTAWLASGMLVPMVNYMLMSMFGGDDDKDKYWSFTKWDRRNNFIMWVPGTHNFVKIPLAQEFRGFYAVGDMIASKLWGGEKAEESWEDYGWDLLGQVVDMLPLDPTGYDGNIAVSLMPNPIRPMFELAFNVDFTGKPLFKDSEYNKYDPNFTKAYVGTPDWLVRISRMVNSIGNDYPDIQQNAIDKFGDPRYNLNNPAVVDHVLSSYLGGAYTMGSQILGVATKMLNGDEVKMADVPVASKFVGNPDDRPASKKQGDEFWTMKERHDRAANTLSKLKKLAKVDGDYSTLDVFFDSDEYKQYKLDDAKVKKYEEEKKKERAEESGDEYKAHKTTAEDIYKAHATPKDDFEDLKMSQIYPKVNGIKKSWEGLLDMVSSQADSFYNENADAIQAADEVADIREQINDIKKEFLSDDGKDAWNAEGMKEIRQLRKEALSILEKVNKVIVAKQKARAEKMK